MWTPLRTGSCCSAPSAGPAADDTPAPRRLHPRRNPAAADTAAHGGGQDGAGADEDDANAAAAAGRDGSSDSTATAAQSKPPGYLTESRLETGDAAGSVAGAAPPAVAAIPGYYPPGEPCRCCSASGGCC